MKPFDCAQGMLSLHPALQKTGSCHTAPAVGAGVSTYPMDFIMAVTVQKHQIRKRVVSCCANCTSS